MTNDFPALFELMRRIAILFLLFVICGCSGPQNQTHEIEGTAAERASAVTRLIESNATLPSKITDAHLIDFQIGDGQLGPSDFRSFAWIKVSPTDVVKWKAALTTVPQNSLSYESPPTKQEWWLTQLSYNNETKFDARTLFDRPGWIIVQDDGNVYVYSYTQ